MKYRVTESFSFIHVLLVFLVVFFNLYSFPLSITITFDLAVLFCILPTTSLSKIRNRQISGIIKSAFFLGLYTYLVYLLNGSDSLYAVGKPVRFIFILILFAILSVKFSKYTIKELVAALLLALLIHLVFVYIEFFIPPLKIFVFSYLDTDKDAILDLSLRAFGLCSSFDGAGLILCILEVLLWLLSLRRKSPTPFMLCILTYVGCFMVSRTTMLVSTLFMVLIILSYAKNNKALLFFFIIPIIFVGSIFVYNLAIDILSSNIIEESYRIESSDKLTGQMLYLPDSLFVLLFGSGQPTDNSDIGYVNQIFMVGLVGMIWILSIYYQSYLLIRRLNSQYYYISSFLFIVLILLVIYNYKLSFLYSRSVSDVYFLFLFIMIRKMTCKPH